LGVISYTLSILFFVASNKLEIGPLIDSELFGFFVRLFFGIYDYGVADFKDFAIFRAFSLSVRKIFGVSEPYKQIARDQHKVHSFLQKKIAS
jgi:hypothetical protein